MSPLSIPDIIKVAKVAEYMSANELALSALFGKKLDTELPKKIYLVRKAVEWMYGQSPTDTSLPATSKYLISLCGYYGLKAQNVIGGPGGSATVNEFNTDSFVPGFYYYTITGLESVINGAATWYTGKINKIPEIILLDGIGRMVTAGLVTDVPAANRFIYVKSTGQLRYAGPTPGQEIVFMFAGSGQVINIVGNEQVGEVPSGAINGVNVTFTLSNTPVPGSVKVFLNGQRLSIGIDYTIIGNIITMIVAPTLTEWILVDYFA